MQPVLAVMYSPDISSVPFRKFADALNSEDLSVHTEERPYGGAYAGLVWTMLTVAAVFIAKSYFDGMLKELGKEHYVLLKKSLAKLTEDTMSEPRIEPVLIGTVGKIKEDDPVSMAFSVWANISDGRTVKLLLPKKEEGVDYAAATNAFLDFVLDCHTRGENVLLESGFDIARRVNPITVIYNFETQKIEWANPFSH